MFSYLQLTEGDQKNIKDDYCWDDDINEIHSMLISLAEQYDLSVSIDEFTVWPHVPQYGYRLWLSMEVTKEILKNNDFQEEIQKITEFSKQRSVELSCMIGACFFYEGDSTAGLSFSTMFMDKKRQRIKI